MPQERALGQLPSGGREVARKLFTNRRRERERFLELLQAPEGSPLPVLMFYGVGGAGKSTLLEHLQEACDERKVPWAAVDFAKARTRDADEALRRLAGQLETSHGLRFPRFKPAMAVLMARETGGEINLEVAPGTKHLRQGLDIALDSLGLFPVAGQLAALVKLGKGAGALGFNKLMKESPPFRRLVQRLDGHGELAKLLEYSDEELNRELAGRFAADLAAALPARPGHVGRGALFFDTHEELWRDEKGGAFAQDAWLRELREYLRSDGVLVVVAGRDHLRWPNDWAEEDAGGRRLWLEQHLIGGLSRRDALEYLERDHAVRWPEQPFTMPEALREAILRVTNENPPEEPATAHHCYLLALCAATVANLKAITGNYPPPSEFNTIPAGDAAAIPLAGCFLRSLRNQAMVSWMEELSLTPRFDEPFASALDDARRHHNGSSGWARLRQLSLVEERADGFLEMHKLFRDSLRARVGPERAADIHDWAATHWATHVGEEWERRGLAWYHRRFIDHNVALQEYRELRLEAAQRARAQVLRHLAAWWGDVELSEAPTQWEEGRDLLEYTGILCDLPVGNRGVNLAQAIACYQAALRVYTEEAFPADWAMTQNNLGATYSELPTGDRGANLADAIDCYQAALRVRTEEAFPADWAMTQNNLGTAYSELPTGDRGANLADAIACYQAALRVYTEEAFPADWAMTQNNLGATYSNLPTGDRGANLADAIACYQAALRVRTEEAFPADWASTQNNLGNAYSELPTGDRGANLADAIDCYQAALRVYTEEAFPATWATIQNNLGTAYSNLPTGDRGANLADAIACYQAALRVRTEEAFPADWASTQNNLGNAYSELPTGDRGANLADAIACYQAALRVYTEEAFPATWAMTQNNLGTAYSNLPTGDRGANLADAIACYQAALRVYTEEAFPATWATIQNNLGNAYSNLPTGDRGANLADAIDCYQGALRVRTEEAFPAQWADTEYNLALARAASGDMDAAREAFTAAARGYRAVANEEEATEAEAARDAL